MKHSIIVSDLHLAARNSRAEAMLRFLDSDFDRLIVNGDTVDHLNLHSYRPIDWEVLGRLAEIARDRELILIRGNHDGTYCSLSRFGPLDFLARLLDVELREDYELWVGRRKYLVLHGDQFDRTLNMSRLGHGADWFYRQTQRVSRGFARWLKRRVKVWGGVTRSVKHGAVEFARRRKCQGVITSHTHFHDEDWLDGLHFLNTGCWVDTPCTYVRVLDATISLCHWDDAETQTVPARPEGIIPQSAEVLFGGANSMSNGFGRTEACPTQCG